VGDGEYRRLASSNVRLSIMLLLVVAAVVVVVVIDKSRSR
jgi:hypothetical protein